MMTSHRFRLLATAVGISSFLSVGIARAQRPAAIAAPRASAAHVRAAATGVAAVPHTGSKISAAPPARLQPRATPSGFFSGSGSFGLFNQINAPDFGFGLNSSLMNQDWAIKAAIDPATEWRLLEAQRVLRGAGFAGSGFYLLDGGGYYEVPPDTGEAEQPPQQQPQQQPIVIVQAPQQAQTGAASAPSESEETSAPPTEDVGQFVLVLRNGTQIEAVAFSRSGDRIVYITVDGLRRALALADIDTQSTIRINEERGTPVQLSL
ncbi:MAG TPA: hypothetical protein VEJ46_04135 [Candidatus Acidoferrum sp.]|nr:hypothetical protein [Candidatus Acidoferrum sp.]